MAVAVMHRGEPLLTRTYGMANLEHRVPITPDTVFDSASLAKSTTAYAIHRLAEEGRLQLSDPVHQYLPQLPDFGHTITLEHLLNHTSGLRDWTVLLGLAGWRNEDLWTTNDVWRMLQRQQGLNFVPGERYMYSNSGYMLLGKVVEQVTGQTLREWSDAEIFEPLGMQHTHVHDDVRRIVPHVATSYQQLPDGSYQRYADNMAVTGSSALFLTIGDLTRWAQFLLENDYAPRADAREQAGTAYRMGLVYEQIGDIRTFGHDGAWAGFCSAMLILPDQELVVAVLSNQRGVDAEEKALAVAGLFVNNLTPAPGSDPGSAPQTIDTREMPSDEALASYVGTYLHDPTMSEYVVTLREEQLWIQRSKGPARVLRPLSRTRFVEDVSGHQVVFSAEEQTVHYNDRALGSRFTRAQPTLQQLAELAGTYRSDELLTRFELVLEGGRLFAVHPRFDPRFPLQPITADRFRLLGTYAGFDVIRDQQQRVIGLAFQSGRVRDLRYDRLLQSD